MASPISFSDRALSIIAENKIRAAIDAGEFDNLPGFGKPSPLIDAPYDPHWWIRQKLQSEQLPASPADGWSYALTSRPVGGVSDADST